MSENIPNKKYIINKYILSIILILLIFIIFSMSLLNIIYFSNKHGIIVVNNTNYEIINLEIQSNIIIKDRINVKTLGANDKIFIPIHNQGGYEYVYFIFNDTAGDEYLSKVYIYYDETIENDLVLSIESFGKDDYDVEYVKIKIMPDVFDGKKRLKGNQ